MVKTVKETPQQRQSTRWSKPKVGREEKKKKSVHRFRHQSRHWWNISWVGVGLLWCQVEKRLLKFDRSHSLGLAFSASLKKPTAGTCAHNFPGSLSSLGSTSKVPGKGSARYGLGSMSTMDSSLWPGLWGVPDTNYYSNHMDGRNIYIHSSSST